MTRRNGSQVKLFSGSWKTYIKTLGINFGESKLGIKDIGVSFVPQIIGVVSGLIASVLIARGLGPAGLGNYALIMSYVGIASLVSDMGIGQTAIRYASLAVANGDISWQSSVLRWALRVRLFLALIAALILGLAAPYITSHFWHNGALTSYIYIALIGGVVAPFALVPSLYFQSNRKFSANSLINSVQRLIGLAGILILATFSWWQIPSVLWSNVIATVVGAVAFVFVIPRDVIFQKQGTNWKTVSLIDLFKCPKSVLNNINIGENPTRFAIYQMMLSIIVTLSSQADIWLMGFFLNNEQIGIYSAATRYTLPFGIVIATINTVLWPRISACATNLSKIRLLEKTLKLSLVLTLLGTIYSYFAPMTMGYLFGTGYSEGILLAQLLCFQKCITLLFCSVSCVGYGFGLLKHYVWIALSCFVVLVLCNIMFLPRFGFYGAAAGLILSETLQMILVGAFILRKYRSVSKLK